MSRERRDQSIQWLMFAVISWGVQVGHAEDVKESPAWTATLVDSNPGHPDFVYRVWAKGNAWRTEERLEGYQGTVATQILVCDGASVWSNDEEQPGYRKVGPSTPGFWNKKAQPNVLNTMKKVGQQTIDGHPCTIYSGVKSIDATATDPKTGRSSPTVIEERTRIWLWKEMHLVLREEATVGTDYKAVREFRGWTLLDPVEAKSLLTVPADQVIQEENTEAKKNVQSSNTTREAGGTIQDATLPQEGAATQVNLANYRGKVVVVNFFATWCGPCNHEMPVLVKAYEEFAPQGVMFLSIDAGPEKEASVRAFMAKYHVTWPVLYDTENLEKQYAPSGLPTTLILDPQGKIRATMVGAVSSKWLREELVKAGVSGTPPHRTGQP